jgi:hypothetical protein
MSAQHRAARDPEMPAVDPKPVSPRYVFVLKDEMFPRHFYVEGEAAQFLQANKDRVKVYFREDLAANFTAGGANCVVWSQTRLHPPEA